VATSIVASVMPQDGAELRRLEERWRGHADLVEVRADRWRGSGEELAAALARLDRPAIATVRPQWEGGAFAGSEAERAALLEAAARTATYVDVELRSSFLRTPFARARRIISLHDFEGTPGDLERAVAELRGAGADAAFVKLAATPLSLGDVARIAGLQRAHAGSTPPLVAIAMGERGLPARLLAGRLGAPLAWGRVAESAPTGPGQPDVADLSTLYRVGQQRPSTAVCAIAGSPIGHSLSPRLHNRLYRHHGLDRVFVPLLADRLEEALALARDLGIDGLSVTLPFKEDAARAASGPVPGFPHPAPEGAVNTLVRRDSGWLAANTDRIGFLAALERGAPDALTAGRKALVLGAGGAARTAAAALGERGLAVSVTSRTFARAAAVARALGAAALPLHAARPAAFDLVVNATPAGMHPSSEESPLPDGALRPGQVVFDLVYRPRRTRLLRQAEAAGARALGGFEMFLAQALAQFRIFTGAAADEAFARSELEGALRR
jgi:3-dehydroquinate dehydratase/shikimate dehydrogenase